MRKARDEMLNAHKIVGLIIKAVKRFKILGNVRITGRRASSN